MKVIDKSLDELLPRSLYTTPAVSISEEDKMWVATAMLINYLESYTDSLVVTDKEYKPIGVIGGIEVIKGVFEDPTSNFFDKSTAGDVMDRDIMLVNSKTKLGSVLEKWKKTRRAFCIIPNEYFGYSALSSRKMLQIGAGLESDLKFKDVSSKEIIGFDSSDTIGEIINTMMGRYTRKLLLKGSNKFISDRMIIERIAKDFCYLRDTEKFLDVRWELESGLEEAKKVDDDMNIADLSKLLLSMAHPYVIGSGSVASPWDICKALATVT